MTIVLFNKVVVVFAYRFHLGLMVVRFIYIFSGDKYIPLPCWKIFLSIAHLF